MLHYCIALHNHFCWFEKKDIVTLQFEVLTAKVTQYIIYLIIKVMKINMYHVIKYYKNSIHNVTPFCVCNQEHLHPDIEAYHKNKPSVNLSNLSCWILDLSEVLQKHLKYIHWISKQSYSYEGRQRKDQTLRGFA